MSKNKNIVFYSIGITLFILLKFAYKQAGSNELSFLLYPTNKIVSVLTGSHSVFKSGEGYHYEQLNIVIDKSCSGYNFWLLCFLMLAFLSVKYVNKNMHKLYALALSFILAYLFTILVNSSRIFTSIIIQRVNLTVVQQNEAMVHQIIGIITNLTFLIIIYLIAEKTINKKLSDEKCN